MELGDQPSSQTKLRHPPPPRPSGQYQQWLDFEGLFPMNSMEQFNDFEVGLRDPHVCIV
jgi:hypothetical protein